MCNFKFTTYQSTDMTSSIFYNDAFRYSPENDEWRKFVFPICTGHFCHQRKKKHGIKEGSLQTRRRLGSGRTRKGYQEQPRIKRWMFLGNKKRSNVFGRVHRRTYDLY